MQQCIGNDDDDDNDGTVSHRLRLQLYRLVVCSINYIILCIIATAI